MLVVLVDGVEPQLTSCVKFFIFGEFPFTLTLGPICTKFSFCLDRMLQLGEKEQEMGHSSP